MKICSRFARDSFFTTPIFIVGKTRPKMRNSIKKEAGFV